MRMTNIASLSAQNQLARTTKMQNSTFAHLSEGKRIISASDDPAGLGIANSMNVQVRSYNQAAMNGNDGIGMINTADKALGKQIEMLSRARNLAMQSANGTLADTPDRANLSVEFNQIANEVYRIQNDAKFNGQTIISDETTTEVYFQVGISGDESSRILVEFNGLDLSAFAAPEKTESSLSIGTQTDAQDTLAVIDDMIQTLSTRRANMGAISNRLKDGVETASTMSVSLAAAVSQIEDADMAKESADMAKNEVMMQAGVSVLAQINQAPQLALKLLQ